MPNRKGPLRNYVNLRSARWTLHGTGPLGEINGFLYAFGADDDDLSEKVLAAQQANDASQPTETFTYGSVSPQTFYVKLDVQNIANIFNRNAEDFWFQSGFGLQVNGFVQDLAVLAATDVEKSPRNSFPTNLGTDGQRLRDGTSKTQGFALNYLAKLFFLTSNQQFKDLFDSLKASKITTVEALAAAKILVTIGR